MAQQSVQGDSFGWKPGTKCDFFDRNIRKWVEAEVIGSHTDDKGEWIKVRYGQKDQIVLSDDPDLRRRELITARELRRLRDAAAQIPIIAPILQKVLPSSSGPGQHDHPDGMLHVLMYMLPTKLQNICFFQSESP